MVAAAAPAQTPAEEIRPIVVFNQGVPPDDAAVAKLNALLPKSRARGVNAVAGDFRDCRVKGIGSADFADEFRRTPQLCAVVVIFSRTGGDLAERIQRMTEGIRRSHPEVTLQDTAQASASRGIAIWARPVA